MSKTTNDPDIGQLPAVEWTEDGTALRITAPDDFTPAQRTEFYDSMAEWWGDYSAKLTRTVIGRKMKAAPACPSWCKFTTTRASGIPSTGRWTAARA